MDRENNYNITELVSPNYGMKRELGLINAIGLMSSLMIGSGIFYIGVYVLDYIHLSTGWAIVAWVVAGLFSLMAGLCYAELGAAMPRSGGPYVYVSEAFGPCAGFTLGWTNFMVSKTGTIAALGLAFATYVDSLLPIPNIAQSFVAVGIIVLLTLINLIGVRQGGNASTVLLVIKLLFIFTVIFAGLVYDGGTGEALSFEFEGENFIGAISMALIAALWAYDGWASVNMVAEEVKNPQRNIPLAMTVSLVGVTVLYTAYNLVLMKILPAEQIASTVNPSFEVAELILGNGAAVFITIGILFSILGACNSCLLAYPRMYYSMARDKRFLPVFGKLDEKTKTPVNSQIITMIYAGVICFFADFQSLVNITILAAWVYYGLGIASVIVLRKKYPNIERPYKVIGYPFMPILAILMTIVMIVANFLADPITIIGLLIPISGVPVYFIVRAYNRSKESVE